MIRLESSGDQVYKLCGSLEHQEVVAAKELVGDLLRSYQDKAVTIDLSDLETVNSIVLSLLLGGVRLARSLNCQLSYINLSDFLFNMARVGGVEAILLSADQT